MLSLLAVALAAEPATVKLLDPGVAPREVLAIVPAEGTVETVAIDMTFAAEVVNEGVALPQQAMPPLHLALRSEVVAVTPEGVHATITVPEVAVGDASGGGGDLQAAMAAATAPMRALQGKVTVDPTGHPTEATWGTTDGGPADPALIAELERAVELLQVPRPAEPLGVGARWTVTRTGTDDMGFAITEVETWTVSSRDEDRWTLDVLTLQKAQVPQVVGGSLLESHRGAAQGRVTLDPHHLLPASVELGLSVRARMKVDGVVRSTTTSTLQAQARRQP